MPDANNGGMSDMKFQIIATLLLCAPLLLSHDFNGRVVAISDGDTVRVMHEGRSEKIRLYGIDAPERGQAFSSSAKQFVSGLCFGKEVTVKARGQDRYQRTMRAGFAWWFRKYAPGDEYWKCSRR